MPQSDSATLDLFENYQDYLALQHLYQAALKQLQMKFEVLNFRFAPDGAPSITSRPG